MVFAVIALFVGAFIIFNTFSITVAQRQKEMALLRALGASRRQVTRSVIIEAFAVGLIASLSGLAAGVGIASLLKALLSAFGIDIPAGGTVVGASTVLISLTVGTIVTVVSAFMPARRAGRVPRSPRCGTSPSIGPAPRSPGWSPVRPCWPQASGRWPLV